MKNVCLENYGVLKLETQEAKTINGGGPLLAVVAGFFLGMFIYELLF